MLYIFRELSLFLRIKKKVIMKNSNKFSNKVNNGIKTVIPVATYYNVGIQKIEILKANRKKSGVYRWRNLITNKSYIGSATNIERRLRDYFSSSFLRKELKRGKSLIYASIIKHDYSNFNLDILEYCEAKDVIKLEQKYLDVIKPEYNLCKTAGSMLGFKHSEATLIKMRQPKTLDHILNLKIHMKKWHTMVDSPFKTSTYRNKLSLMSARATPVEVTDIETGVVSIFSSARKAAKCIKCHKSSVSSKLSLKSLKPIKGRFIIKPIYNN
jgi:group I intron endonuclease